MELYNFYGKSKYLFVIIHYSYPGEKKTLIIKGKKEPSYMITACVNFLPFFHLYSFGDRPEVPEDLSSSVPLWFCMMEGWGLSAFIHDFSQKECLWCSSYRFHSESVLSGRAQGTQQVILPPDRSTARRQRKPHKGFLALSKSITMANKQEAIHSDTN